ncbi:hypothetical protein ACWPOB_20345 [Rhodococcus sp. 2H158]
MANYTYDTLPDPIRELVPTNDELASAVDATLHELTVHSSEDSTADGAQEEPGTAR